MPIELRDYQEKLFQDTRQLIGAGERSVLLQLPTGGGKTAIATQILKRASEKGHHCHFWVHRVELLRQSVLAMDKAGVECGIIAAGFPARPDAPVQICSIPSLPRRLSTIKHPGIIVVDEAHRSVSASYSKLIAHYSDAVILGLSATPSRLDGSGLNKWFNSMVLGPSTAQLIDSGWLSPYKIFAPKPLDLSQIDTLAGDYNKKQLDEKMKVADVSGDAVAHYQKFVPGQKALCFAWSVESSEQLAARFMAAGIPAAHLDGNTSAQIREQVIRDFSAGTIKVLTNCDLFGEGFDCPSISCLFLLRPTQSLGLYLQQVGRGLRINPDKDVCTIFDHCGNTLRHGFPSDDRIWSLEGKKKKKREESDGPLCRTCPRCHLVSRLSIRICECGYKLVLDREMEIDEKAELQELDPAVARQIRRQEQARADSLEKLVEFGRLKGYKHPTLWAKFVIEARERKKKRRDILSFPTPQPQNSTWDF